MGFDTWFRLSVHAVITNDRSEVLLLKATYGDQSWGLPGGALDSEETIHQALERECLEELGCTVHLEYLSGVYAHRSVQSHAFIFRCSLPREASLQLSSEHSAARYFPAASLEPVQQRRVLDCLGFEGQVRSAAF